MISDIQIAMESGETWQEIEERMGTSATVASEFNDNFSNKEKKAYKRLKVKKIITAVLVVITIICIGVYWILPKFATLSSSKEFDENIVINQAEEIILLINDDDYETIQSQYANSIMQTTFEDNSFQDIKKKIALKWGEFKSFGTSYTSELTQSGKKYAVIEMQEYI